MNELEFKVGLITAIIGGKDPSHLLVKMLVKRKESLREREKLSIHRGLTPGHTIRSDVAEEIV